MSFIRIRIKKYCIFAAYEIKSKNYGYDTDGIGESIA